ncbi:MAG: hypothetical protein LBQ75_04705 [Zoogloeaceae bacterium]|nr:hypothetical protein [Zoogloeaceae bacterium]
MNYITTFFKRLALFAGSLALAVGLNACQFPDEIVSVTVRDSEFREIKTLSATELAKFSELWSRRLCEEDTSSKAIISYPPYKIDITTLDRGTQEKEYNRWLYDPVGVTQVLLKHLVTLDSPEQRFDVRFTLWCIDSPERLNVLLGIEGMTHNNAP